MRLLIAEDDAGIARPLAADLEREGFAVDIVAEGVDAAHMGNTEPYDAIILDLGLPGRPGLEVLRDWRREGLETPVLILTARGAWHEKVEGFRAGADDYLAKPFHFEELLVRVQALIRRARGVAGSEIRAGNLALDEERQCVRRDDESIRLTGTEFRLLRYLMLHPGRVISGPRLLEHAYDFNEEKESNVIEVYISRLRKKIGRERIRTRRGQGYIFEPGEGA